MKDRNKNEKKFICLFVLILCIIPIFCGCSNEEIRTKSIEEICGVSLDNVQTVFEDSELAAKEDVSEYFSKQFLEYTDKGISDTEKAFYIYDKDNNLILQIEIIDESCGQGVICLTDSVCRCYYREITGTPTDEDIRRAQDAIKNNKKNIKSSKKQAVLLGKLGILYDRLYNSVPALIIRIALCLFGIFTRWLLLRKVGEKGWKSIIPFYGECVWLKAIGTVSSFVILVCVFVIYFITVLSGDLETFIEVILDIVVLIVNIFICRHASRCFGRGRGFAFGLYFLPVIFYAMLAFGKAEYIEPMEEY